MCKQKIQRRYVIVTAIQKNTDMKEVRRQFNMALSEEDLPIIAELRNEYSVNLSRFFK